MKFRTTTTAGLVSLAVASLAVAANPRGTASAQVGGKQVTIDYGRPALNGRSLDELMKQLPADRIWRAGENQVSTLTTAGGLVIGGTAVPAGKYSVYVHAGEAGAWSLILNKNLGVPLGQIWDKAPDNLKNEPWPHLMDYTKGAGAQEIVRAKMTAAKAAAPADLFTITLTPKGPGAELTLAWGTQAWSAAIQPGQ